MKQVWDAKTYANNARFVSDLGMPAVEWLNPRTGLFHSNCETDMVVRPSLKP
jgi:hypothetical protein